MNRSLAHRGPDDEGVAVVGAGELCLSLGHRRLAVIDPSPAGHQPMEDPETGCWITYNGECYNFPELRKDLQSHGVRFRTTTDTEVILKAYGRWGKDFVRRLRGIFAFGIWDPRRRTLLLARDQLGVKPLYLWQKGGRLVFASEVRAILASGLVERKLEPDGLLSYLAYGSVQEPFTLVQGVRSLPAGHLLEWADGKVMLEEYWRLPIGRQPEQKDPAAILAEMKVRLQDAVAAQLIADVPLGAFLSGGIDSTAIAALMQDGASGPVRTFSLVFEEQAYDERRFSRLAARHIGTEHTEVLLSGGMVLAHLGQALDSYDQPSVDGLNTWFVSKAAKEAGLTVALSGVGGDELFGGYEGYRKALAAERWGRLLGLLPAWLKGAFARAAAPVARKEAARKAVALLSTAIHPYFVTRRLFDQQQIGSLLNGATPLSSDWQDHSFGNMGCAIAACDPINRASALELQTYMRNTLLRDTDQMSMAHALEVRVPLLDHKLVEFCFTIPGKWKLDPTQPKPLLTRPVDGRIPEECIHRPKRGFELPFQVWLKEALREEMREALCTRQDKGPFSSKGLRTLWAAFEAGRVNWSRVWAVYVLKRWLERQRIAG